MKTIWKVYVDFTDKTVWMDREFETETGARRHAVRLVKTGKHRRVLIERVDISRVYDWKKEAT